MSASNSARCLLRRSRIPSSLPLPASQRTISQSSRRRQGEKEPQGTAERNARPGKTQAPALRSANSVASSASTPASVSFPAYTEEEKEFLRRKYTPEQMLAIEASEAAIDPQDLEEQGVLRNDPIRLKYLDDFSTIHPIVDKKRLAPISNHDPKLRYKTDDELDEDIASFTLGIKEDSDVSLEWRKFEDNLRMTVGKEEAERDPVDYRAPLLPKLQDRTVKRTATRTDVDETDSRALAMERLSKSTGLTVSYLKRLRQKILVNRTVSNQTRLGKIRSVSTIMVVGNEAGLMGIGEGKSTDAEAARFQALQNAVKNMVPIPRYEDRTIYGDAKGKVSATEVSLYHRPPGFGVRCQEKIYEMCKCAGIDDLAAKVTRSRNPSNIVKATMQALLGQRLPEEVALGRGKKMIDVRKVYYGGMA